MLGSPFIATAKAGEALADFTLEQLSQIVVTSVSRHETSLATAPASIFRITPAMIRRSGATTLAEALRLAPNLQVARVDAGTYAITARGFGTALQNKLLVMIDGRRVYSPLFSGVFWDAQDVVLEDVERIEVISGPGSTIWGATAVNGVINVITRRADDTHGTLLVAGVGSDEHTGIARFGAPLGNAGHYRLYAKFAGRDDMQAAPGAMDDGGWRRRQAGFRADFKAGGFDVALTGDGYAGALGQARGRDPVRSSGANVVTTLRRDLDDGSDIRLQFYFDHARREQPGTGEDRIDTLDVEFQHDLPLLGGHILSWGAGYRHSHDRFSGSGSLYFIPPSASLSWSSVFVQDEIRLRPGLRLTLGARLEDTSYTGAEWLPTVRLAHNLDPDNLLWVAATRALRTPSRIDRDLYVVGAGSEPPSWVVVGDAGFGPERANVLEAGYRGQWGPAVGYAITAFVADYDELRTLEPRDGQPSVFRNLGQARTRGIELGARWQVLPGWRLSGGGVLQDIDTTVEAGSRDVTGRTGLATNDPSHYWRLHSAHELAPGLQLDAELRGAGRLPRPAVPSYHALDLRLGWQVARGIELSVTGRNLLHGAHPEFGPPLTRQSVGRSVVFNLSARF